MVAFGDESGGRISHLESLKQAPILTPQSCHLDRASDGRGEFISSEGFGHVIECTVAHRGDCGADAGIAYHDHRDIGTARPQPAQQLGAVDPWSSIVSWYLHPADYDIGVGMGERRECGFAGRAVVALIASL